MLMLRKIIIIVTALLLPTFTYAKENVDWLIYLYLVGSDLESGGDDPDAGGAATIDLGEIIDSNIKNNIKFVIMTGGASSWNNNVVDPNKVQIYESIPGDIQLAAEYQRLNMGDPDTLQLLLEHGESKFNPKKRMIIFWDHGAGPTGGVGYDEYTQDFLTTSEIQKAFSTIFPSVHQPFEVVGFDACLMGNIDVAYSLINWSKYLVASEELEPGLGWYYTGWLNKLATKPTMNGAELGKAIADTFLTECRENGLEDVTLSVVDLSKFAVAGLNYIAIADNIFNKTSSDNVDSIITQLGQAANKAESYGSSSDADSIDLYHYVSNLPLISQDLRKDTLNSIKDAVVYKVNGKARRSNGISIYYPLSHNPNQFKSVYQNGMTNSLLFLNSLLLGVHGSINENEFDKKIEATYSDLVRNTNQIPNGKETPKEDESPKITANQVNFEEHKGVDLSKLKLDVKFDEESNSYIKIPKDYLQYVEKVEFMLAVIELPTEKEDGVLVMLGTDDSIIEDWDNGIFTDQFQNTWPHFGDNVIPSIYEDTIDNISRYTSQIKVNGVSATMEFTYNFDTKTYTLINITKNSKDGVPTRTNIKLKDGDKITTVLSGSTIPAGDKEGEDIEFDFETFKYKKGMTITQQSLGTDATFALVMRAVAANGTEAEADPIIIVIPENDEDKLQMYTLDDYVEEKMGNNQNNNGSNENGKIIGTPIGSEIDNNSRIIGTPIED